jgi:nucleoside-diphosphate-sugar epimerase
MRVFVAGATGVIGRQLVPQLVEAGHQVVGSTRSTSKAGWLANAGAEAVVMDPLDRTQVMTAVMRAEPDVVVHELTALRGKDNPRRFDRWFAETNDLRTRGIDILLEAARAAGATRFLAQSYTGWPNAREGGPVKTEDDRLDPDPPKWMRESIAAIRYLEATVTAAEGLEGLALRYGSLYGPGTSMAEEYAVLIRRRKFPIVGDGAGVWSFVHVADAAAATVVALDQGGPGVYNIVDNDPAPVSQWLPHLAEVLGAKRPRHVPVWLGRLAAGEVGVAMMTESRGSSNAKARRELGWEPAHPSWRSGFAETFAGTAARAGRSRAQTHER